MRCPLFALIVLWGPTVWGQMQDERTGHLALIFKDPQVADLLLHWRGDTLWISLGERDSAFFRGDQLPLHYRRPLPPYHPTDSLPLLGLRIALDPGHMAGTFEEAKLEGKYVELPGVRVFEANHTLATARLLKARLEAKGATVLITIDSLGLGARGISFDNWWRRQFYSDLKLALDSAYIEPAQAARFRTAYTRARTADKRTLYRGLFNLLDLHARAQKINAFQPDLTLVIHFNVEVNNAPWTSPCATNGNMAFVGGAFLKGEYEHPLDQKHLIRLTTSSDLRESIRLCGHMVTAFEDKLGVPLVTDTAGIIYLSQWSLPTKAPGVYARNLSLTRLIEGPLCFGETLYQDNAQESQWLNEKTLQIGACTYNSRILQVVDAYENGLERYLSDPNRPK